MRGNQKMLQPSHPITSENENGDENGGRWEDLSSLSVLVAVIVNRSPVTVVGQIQSLPS